MSDPPDAGDPFAFSLPDADGSGESLDSETLAAEYESVLVVLLRSHYCPQCRELVKRLRDEYDAFVDRSTAVVPVLPDCPERAAVWRQRYDVPFLIPADPGEGAGRSDSGGEGEGESTFDAFGPFQRRFDELPAAVLFVSDGERLRVARVFEEETGEAFPDVDRILSVVDALADRSGADPTES